MDKGIKKQELGHEGNRSINIMRENNRTGKGVWGNEGYALKNYVTQIHEKNTKKNQYKQVKNMQTHVF